MFSVVSAALIAFSRPVISSFTTSSRTTGDDVVGLLEMLVVLQHHPAVRADDARGREQQSDVDRAAVERRDGQRSADVERLEAPEHHAVRVLESDDAERTCRSIRVDHPASGCWRWSPPSPALGDAAIVVPTRPARARDDASTTRAAPRTNLRSIRMGLLSLAQGSTPDPTGAQETTSDRSCEAMHLQVRRPVGRPRWRCARGRQPPRQREQQLRWRAPAAATRTAPAVVIVRSPCCEPVDDVAAQPTAGDQRRERGRGHDLHGRDPDAGHDHGRRQRQLEPAEDLRAAHPHPLRRLHGVAHRRLDADDVFVRIGGIASSVRATTVGTNPNASPRPPPQHQDEHQHQDRERRDRPTEVRDRARRRPRRAACDRPPPRSGARSAPR